MTFKANLLLRVRLSKISLFCAKVGKVLCRSHLAEAKFLSSAIYSFELFLARHRRAIFRNAFFVCFVVLKFFRGS